MKICRAVQKSFYVLLLNVLITGLGISQTENTITIDSLIKLYENSPTDSMKISWGLTIVKHLGITNPNKAKKYASESIMLAQKAQRKPDEVEALLALTILSGRTSKLDSVLLLSEYTLPLAKEIKDSLAIQSCLGNLGIYHKMMGNYRKAIRYTVMKDEYGFNLELKVSTNNQVGHIYFDVSEIDSALLFFKKAALLCENPEVENTFACGISLMGLGSCYEKLDRLDSALIYVDSVLSFSEKNNYRTLEANAYSNKGFVLMRKNQCAAAIPAYLKAIDIAAEVNDLEMLGLTYLNLAACYRKGGKMSLAKETFLKGISILKPINILKLRDPYRNLFEIYKEENNYREALKWHEKYKVINDSFLTQKVRSLNLFKQEKLLLENRVKAQELELSKLREKNQEQQNYALLWIVGLLTLVVAVFLIQNKRVRTKAKKIEALNQDLSKSAVEISLLNRELTHRVKNNLNQLQGIINMEELELESEQGVDHRHVLHKIGSYIQALANLYSLLDDKKQSNVNAKVFFSELNEHYSLLGGGRVKVHIQNIPNTLYQARTTIQLTYVLIELINNALKHAFQETENPRINVCFKQSETYTTIEVEDNGVGMTPEKMRSSSGTSIVKDLIEFRMRGSLALNNTERGTLYTINIPNESILWKRA